MSAMSSKNLPLNWTSWMVPRTGVVVEIHSQKEEFAYCEHGGSRMILHFWYFFERTKEKDIMANKFD